VTDAALAGAALSTATELEEHQFCSVTRVTSATTIAPWGPWSPTVDPVESILFQVMQGVGPHAAQLVCVACHRGGRWLRRSYFTTGAPE
jgi:hypothetical protein